MTKSLSVYSTVLAVHCSRLTECVGCKPPCCRVARSAVLRKVGPSCSCGQQCAQTDRRRDVGARLGSRTNACSRGDARLVQRNRHGACPSGRGIREKGPRNGRSGSVKAPTVQQLAVRGRCYHLRKASRCFHLPSRPRDGLTSPPGGPGRLSALRRCQVGTPSTPPRKSPSVCRLLSGH